MTNTESIPPYRLRELSDMREFLAPDHIPIRQFMGTITPLVRQFRVETADTQSTSNAFTFDVMRLQRVMADCLQKRARFFRAGPSLWGIVQRYVQHTVPQINSPKYEDPTNILDTLYHDDGTSYQAVTMTSWERYFTERQPLYRAKVSRNIGAILEYARLGMSSEVTNIAAPVHNLNYESELAVTPEGFAMLSAHVVMYRPELPIDVRPTTAAEIFSYGAAIRTVVAKDWQ